MKCAVRLFAFNRIRVRVVHSPFTVQCYVSSGVLSGLLTFCRCISVFPQASEAFRVLLTHVCELQHVHTGHLLTLFVDKRGTKWRWVTVPEDSKFASLHYSMQPRKLLTSSDVWGSVDDDDELQLTENTPDFKRFKASLKEPLDAVQHVELTVLAADDSFMWTKSKMTTGGGDITISKCSDKLLGALKMTYGAEFVEQDADAKILPAWRKLKEGCVGRACFKGEGGKSKTPDTCVVVRTVDSDGELGVCFQDGATQYIPASWFEAGIDRDGNPCTLSAHTPGLFACCDEEKKDAAVGMPGSAFFKKSGGEQSGARDKCIVLRIADEDGDIRVRYQPTIVGKVVLVEAVVQEIPEAWFKMDIPMNKRLATCCSDTTHTGFRILASVVLVLLELARLAFSAQGISTLMSFEAHEKCPEEQQEFSDTLGTLAPVVVTLFAITGILSTGGFVARLYYNCKGKSANVGIKTWVIEKYGEQAFDDYIGPIGFNYVNQIFCFFMQGFQAPLTGMDLEGPCPESIVDMIPVETMIKMFMGIMACGVFACIGGCVTVMSDGESEHSGDIAMAAACCCCLACCGSFSLAVAITVLGQFTSLGGGFTMSIGVQGYCNLLTVLIMNVLGPLFALE